MGSDAGVGRMGSARRDPEPRADPARDRGPSRRRRERPHAGGGDHRGRVGAPRGRRAPVPLRAGRGRRRGRPGIPGEGGSGRTGAGDAPGGTVRAEPPDEVRRLAGERQRARDGRDYAAADALRDRIREAGFEVVDTPEGPVLEWRAFDGPDEPGPTGPRVIRPSEVVRLLDQPPAFDASVHWLVQGWPDDVIRGIDSFRRHHPGAAIKHVVVDAADVDPRMWPEDVDLVRLPAGTGWATARNAGLVRAAGPVVLVVDGSVEADGDVLGPLAATLEDPAVGVAGPF